MTNSRKITIAVDLDGVVVDILTPWLKTYNEETGENVTEADIKSFNMFDYVKQPIILDYILNRKDFFISPPVHKDSLKYFDKILKDKDLDVYIVTQVPRSSMYGLYEKRTWLKNNFKNFETDRVISAHKKFLIDVDVLVDDNPIHLREFKIWRSGRITVAMDHLYNKDVTADYRVNNWQELYEVVVPEIKRKKRL